MSPKQGIEEVGTEEEPLTWKAFIKKVQEDIATYKEETKKPGAHSPWIYRGQSNSTWALKTSLERYLEDELGQQRNQIPVRDYYVKLSAIVPAINSLTNRKFKDFDLRDHKYDERESLYWPLHEYELLCYARHHGFPSPLLDWTETYYVAAFFAFSGVEKETKNVSIYALRCGPVRGGGGSNPYIEELSPYVETHPRHYAQQSRYTVCRNINDRNVYFRRHEEVLSAATKNQTLKKFIISAQGKERVLEELHTMNINAHTLLGDEGALLKTLAYKEFVVRGK